MSNNPTNNKPITTTLVSPPGRTRKTVEPETPAPTTPHSAVRHLLTTAFEGHTLDVVEVNGKPCIPIQQVGSVLGYADDGKRLSRSVANEWTQSGEMVEGEDYHRLEGDVLRAIKEVGTSGVPTYARQLLVFTEQGLHKVCLLTDAELGQKLRHILATEVMPKLHRGEAIPATPAEALAKPKETEAEREERLWAKERRLQAQLELRQVRQQADLDHRYAELRLRADMNATEMERAKSEAQRARSEARQTDMALAAFIESRIQKAAAAGHIDPKVAQAQLPKVLAIASGEDWTHLGVRVPGLIDRSIYLSPTEMAKRLGLDPGEGGKRGLWWVGEAIKHLGLKEQKHRYIKIPKPTGNRLEDGSEQLAYSYEYEPSVLGEVEAWLRDNAPSDLWRDR